MNGSILKSCRAGVLAVAAGLLVLAVSATAEEGRHPGSPPSPSFVAQTVAPTQPAADAGAVDPAARRGLGGKAEADALTKRLAEKPEPPPGVDFRVANAPKFTQETYPKTDGSTSAQPLGAIVAYKQLNVPYAWGAVRWQSDRWIVPAAMSGEHGMPALTPSDPSAPLLELQKRLNHTGTHQAYVNIIEGKSDLAYICRVPSEDEIKLAKDKKVELEIKPVAMDAFVFIVNEKSHLKGLSLQQIRDIFSGKTTNWKDVGGPDAKINAYSRERNSGSQELMDKLVMKDLKMAELRSVELHGMAGPYNRLDEDEAGISYTVYFYQKYMAMQVTSGWGRPDSAKRPPVRMIAVEGVEPTFETIANGKYPLTAEVYVVIRKDAKADSPARELRDYLLTKDGQALVGATGYVPVPGAKKPAASTRPATAGS